MMSSSPLAQILSYCGEVEVDREMQKMQKIQALAWLLCPVFGLTGHHLGTRDYLMSDQIKLERGEFV